MGGSSLLIPAFMEGFNMTVQICVGSSCHLKGSQELAEMLGQAIESNGLSDEITLTGSFCIGKCNRIGVTIQVDDEVFTGITKENFKEFLNENILSKFTSKGA